ncbi:S9 family peptidase [Modestobacter sp. Leaf380]|uniref:alpha/beta hydrolase family protein n=1 Tax=Modestobacter sp. Leaf380 TaxID=1736356 RepID=UPI000A6B9FBE|nr:dienelactone hydrolase family protein [Modestobacter sp. Leaf380]
MTAPSTGTVPPTELDPATAAMHRAAPATRLVDYGMDPAEARALLARTAGGEDWTTVAESFGTAQRVRSGRAADMGHPVTATEAAGFAAAAFTVAQLALNADDDRKRDLYRAHVEAVARVATLRGPAMERVVVPYRGGELSGWLCLPPSGTADATVVVWGGMSGWGASFLGVADAYTRRGLACLLAEGPGQGVPRLEHGLHVDEHVAAGFGAFLDVVERHPALGDRVGVHGNSFGGLFAALLAASDDRVGACVVNGGPPAPGVPEFRAAREQLLAATGTDDLDRLAQVLAALAFDGSTAPVRCPLLVLHGGRDPLVTQEQQELFTVGADPRTTMVRVWPDGEHTLYGHSAGRNALTADWTADQLLR